VGSSRGGRAVVWVRKMSCMTDYRASVDGRVSFANGGSIVVEGFRLDVAGADVGDDEVGRLLVASLGLLMADDVALARVDVIEEPHKGTRGGPSDPAAAPGTHTGERMVDLSHPIRDGMVTLPGLPGPEITAFLTREASRATYAEGTTFDIGRISMIANTGTYVDAPFHRFAGRADLSGLPLERLADVPATLVDVRGSGRLGVAAAALAPYDVTGRAVLVHTGDSARFGTPEYVADAHFVTRDGAASLVERGAAVVGIDAANVDDMTDATRPAHTLLLDAGIPVVEHLTGLDALSPGDAIRFTAVPPMVEGMGTFPVRAFAIVHAQ
jgi:kynurenine formamidase